VTCESPHELRCRSPLPSVGWPLDGSAKIGVLAGSVLSALLAAVILRIRNGRYRRICAEEELDSDADGVPDVYQPGGQLHR
jgi:NhaA family Na+:H+ antiporter